MVVLCPVVEETALGGTFRTGSSHFKTFFELWSESSRIFRSRMSISSSGIGSVL